MLASVRRNNMAQPAGSTSADSLFDFLDDGFDTTSQPEKGTDGTRSVQPVTQQPKPLNMDILNPAQRMALAKEVTDMSFQSIEEVIEIAEDDEGTREADSSKVEPPSAKGPDVLSTEKGRASPTTSVLSDISLPDNKTVSTQNLNGDVTASKSPPSKVNKSFDKDELEGIDSSSKHSVVDIESLSQHESPTVETELTFSRERDAMNTLSLSNEEIPTTKLESESTGKEESDVERLSKTPEQTNEEIEFSWINDGKDAKRDSRTDILTISPALSTSRSNKQSDISWLASGKGASHQATSGTKLASLPESKEELDSTWVISGDTDVENTESTRLANRPVSKGERDLDWLANDKDTDQAQSGMKLAGRSGSKNDFNSGDNVEKTASGFTPSKETLGGSEHTNQMDVNSMRIQSDVEKEDSISSVSNISQKSSQRVSPISQSPLSKKELDASWFKDNENITVNTRERSPGPTDSRPSVTPPNEHVSSPKDSHSPLLQYKAAASDRQSQLSVSYDGESKVNTSPLGMKDLNFDFLKEDTVGGRATGDATARSDDVYTGVNSASLSNVQPTEKEDTVHSRNDIADDNVTGPKSNVDTPARNKHSSASEVSKAIHSAITHFYDKGESDRDVPRQEESTIQQNENSRISRPKGGNKNAARVTKATVESRSNDQKNSKPPKEPNEPKVAKQSKKKRKSKHKSVKEAKAHKKVDLKDTESQNDNGNSNKGGPNEVSVESFESYEGLNSTLASSDTVLPVEDEVSNYSPNYEDDFENDLRSVQSAASSKNATDSETNKNNGQRMPYSTPYGSVYSAFARQPKQPVKYEKVKFPDINARKPVQITSGHSSFSEQSYSTTVKRKWKPNRHNLYMDESYECVASSESDSKPEVNVRKTGKGVPVPLKAEAIYRNGKLEVSIVDERHSFPEGGNLDVKITVVHRHMNGLHFPKKKPRRLPKLNYDTNRDILSQRASYPPFNTHTDPQASERFKQSFGT